MREVRLLIRYMTKRIILSLSGLCPLIRSEWMSYHTEVRWSKYEHFNCFKSVCQPTVSTCFFYFQLLWLSICFELEINAGLCYVFLSDHLIVSWELGPLDKFHGKHKQCNRICFLGSFWEPGGWRSVFCGVLFLLHSHSPGKPAHHADSLHGQPFQVSYVFLSQLPVFCGHLLLFSHSS